MSTARQLGATGVSLSPICLGTMRLDASGLDAPGVARLLHELTDRGITTVHSSHEYSSHELVCAGLRLFKNERPAARLTHIVKLGAPHFDEAEFVPGKFEALIDKARHDLQADCIDVVQWLVRHKPLEDGPRLAIVDRAWSTLAETWHRVRDASKAKTLTSFPYSGGFAERVLSHPAVSGLATYLNPVESEYVALLDGLRERGQGLIAIRPLFAGWLSQSRAEAVHDDPTVQAKLVRARRLAEGTPLECFSLRYSLLHPAVASAMVSIRSAGQAQLLLSAVESLQPDAHEFEALTRSLATDAQPI